MNLSPLFTASIALLALSLSTPTLADEHEHEHKHEHHDPHEEHADHAAYREHGSHVHGVSELNLALVGEAVEIELTSPAANIVGFEHTPSTAEQKSMVQQAVATLKQAEKLFIFSADANCELESAQVATPLLTQKDEHESKPHHDEHAEHDEDMHSEFHAEYQFHCHKPAQLRQLTLKLFDQFPATKTLKVQFVTEKRQGAIQLSKEQTVVRF